VRTAALAALLLIATGIVFGQTLDHDFLDYDDDVYVTDNPNLRDGPTPAAIARAFREPYEANWIPLTWISLQVDYALFGADPAGYHATNTLLHALAALLLFAALLRMTGDALPAAFVAAVFAVHPLHVESVAWIAERKDVLSGLAFSATLLAYARYAEAPSAGRYVLVLAASLAGMLAKPMLVTLPFVLWLLDLWPLKRMPWRGALPIPSGRVLWEKLPILGFAVLTAVAAIWAQQGAGTMDHGEALPLWVRLANGALAYAAYVRDALWPTRLSVFYPHPGEAVSLPMAGAAALAIAVATFLAIRVVRTRPHVTVGWLWFLGMLLPVIGLVQAGMQARADRYTYLPLTGLAIALAWTLRDAARTPGARRGVLAFGAIAVVAMTVGARVQTRHWQDTESLFRHAAEVTQDNFLAHQWLGSLLLRRGELDAAEANFREALRSAPEWSQAQRGIADVYAERGDWPEAIRAYDRALRLTPRDARGHLRLARALAANGQTSEALGRARHAVRLAQGLTLAEAQLILGSILSARGDLPNALVAFDAAVTQAPALSETHVARGLALLELGRLEEADEAIARGEQLGARVDAIAAALTELARSVDARDDPALATAIALRAEALSARESSTEP